MTDDSACKYCGGTGINKYYGYDCSGCDGSGRKVNPKVRAECECGSKQTRFTTPHTSAAWMRKHIALSHRYDMGDA